MILRLAWYGRLILWPLGLLMLFFVVGLGYPVDDPRADSHNVIWIGLVMYILILVLLVAAGVLVYLGCLSLV